MSVPTLERPPEPIAPSRRPVMLWLLIVAALVSLAIALVLSLRSAGGGSPVAKAHERPPLLPAATGAAPFVVTGADGRTVTCPVGSEPSVYLTEATFTPKLVNGSIMKKGRYHIRLRGSVNNETDAAVDVRTFTVSVRGRFWNARITVPHAIAPQSSVRVEIDGDYLSTKSGTAHVATHVDWRWHSADLTACGDAGLVEDD
jgi:hypothetical protein